jgi:hypothetical protein
MADGGYKYAWRVETVDADWVVRGLWAFVVQYMQDNNITPANPRLRVGDLIPQQAVWNTAGVHMYYNNWEVVDMRFFRNDPRVVAWRDAVYRSWNIYYRRWGDAPLRWLTVQMFLQPSEVKPYSRADFRYMHSTNET